MNNKSFKKNTKGRDFVVGDIHGNLDAFRDKLLEIDFDYSKDRIFSVGDLVDRGDKSYECLELTRLPWFHAVRGNHEQMLLDSYQKGGDYMVMHHMNGGEWFNLLDAEDKFQCSDMVKRMPFSITVDDIGICHAQPPSDNWNDVYNPTDDHVNDMLWGRSMLEWRKYLDDKPTQNIRHTYHGHTGVKEPVTVGNSTFIDTMYVGGYLTIMEI